MGRQRKYQSNAVRQSLYRYELFNKKRDAQVALNSLEKFIKDDWCLERIKIIREYVGASKVRCINCSREIEEKESGEVICQYCGYITNFS